MTPKIGQEMGLIGFGAQPKDPMDKVPANKRNEVRHLLERLKMAEAFGETKSIGIIKAQLAEAGYELPKSKNESQSSIFGGNLNKNFQNAGGYIIQQGDTLSKIAKQCGVNLQDLIAANPQIKNPNQIQVGQAIVIPQPGAAMAKAENKPAEVKSEDAPAEVKSENTSAGAKTENPKQTDGAAGPTDAQKAIIKQEIANGAKGTFWDPKSEHLYIDVDGDGEYDKSYYKDGRSSFDLTKPISPEQEKSMRNAGKAPAVWYNPLTWF